MLDVIHVTEEGLRKMRSELHNLEHIERPETVIALEEARTMGDLKENAEYHAAKEKLSLIDSRISEIQHRISKARVVEKTNLKGKIGFGSIVTVFNSKINKEQTYTIVSVEETDIKEMKISVETPIAKALLGKKEGQVAVAQVPSGVMEMKILKIE